MTDTQLLEHPKVKQTLTSVDEKYWYPFSYKVQHHKVTCECCGRTEQSTLTYKIFAHYLYTPHTGVTKWVPIGGSHVQTPGLPTHIVHVESTQSTCHACAVPTLEFNGDTEYRSFVMSRAAEITQAARRSNELREIFGGPPARKAAPAAQAAPKVTLFDFLKGM